MSRSSLPSSFGPSPRGAASPRGHQSRGKERLCPRITVDEQIAEGDKVASRWTGRGTHDGDLMGVAPTGKQVTVSGLTFSRLANGKVVEEYTNWDTFGMMQQLGVVPELAHA